MKNKLSKPTFLIFTVCLMLFAFNFAFAQEKFNVKKTEAILITVTMLEMHDKPKPQGDEALLITDKTEIARFVKLFDGNRKSALHACGYHWRITFISATAEPTDIWFNQECEEFEKNTGEICETVQAKFSAIKKTPTYFVTEIGIDVNVSPAEAIKKLKENPNFNIFVLGDPDKRFPSLEVEATAASEIPENRQLWDKAKDATRKKAEMILTEESKRIGQSFAVLKNGEFQFNKSMFGGGKIEETPRMKIFFQVGTKLDGIEKSLLNAKFIEKTEPQVYFLQLVCKNRFSDSFAKQITDEFPFVKQTFAYTSYPR